MRYVTTFFFFVFVFSPYNLLASTKSNIIENLNLDFNSDILVNGCYFKLRNIKNDLDFNKVNDPSNNQKYSYFLFQEKKPKLTDIKAIDENSTVSDLIITIPSKPWSEKTSSNTQISHSVNDHLVTINKNQIEFNFNENYNNPQDTSDNIFCYYNENSQEQLRKFNMRNIESDGVKYLRTDATFNDFFNDHSNNIQIYRENYVPILIYFNNRGLELITLGIFVCLDTFGLINCIILLFILIGLIILSMNVEFSFSMLLLIL